MKHQQIEQAIQQLISEVGQTHLAPTNDAEPTQHLADALMSLQDAAAAMRRTWSKPPQPVDTKCPRPSCQHEGLFYSADPGSVLVMCPRCQLEFLPVDIPDG